MEKRPRELIQLYVEAWTEARSKVDHRGEVTENPSEVLRKFLRRKTPASFPQPVGEQALRMAFNMYQELEKYRRATMGTTYRNTINRYNTLLELAKYMKEAFPDAPETFILLACREFEYRWDR